VNTNKVSREDSAAYIEQTLAALAKLTPRLRSARTTRLHRERFRKLASLGIISLPFVLNACALPYIHDDAAQKASETAQASWKAADPTAIFESQKVQFAALAGDEAASIKAAVTTQRDLQLIMLIRGNRLGISGLRDRLGKLTGGVDPVLLRALDTTISQARTIFDLDNLRLQDVRKQFIQAGFTEDVSDCSKLGPPPPIPSLANLRDALLDQIKMACADVSARDDRIEQDISVAYRLEGTNRNGALGQTVTDLLAARKELQDQMKKAATLKETLASLKKQIDGAEEPATEDFARSALKFCAADPSTTTAAKAADAPPTLQQAFDKCIVNVASKADPAVKAIKHHFLAGEIQSVISAVLSAQSNSVSGQTTPPAPKISSSTTAALKTLDFLTKAADQIAANSQPSVNALLVALAYEQHQAAMNDLAVQTLRKRVAILTEKREAQIAEISHLARAIAAGAAPASGSVLSEVNAAWNVGRYRAELADHAIDDLIRRDSLQQASEVATSWKNVLQPALDELVAYGKGGLDQQTLANLIVAAINAGGFSAVAARIGK